MMEVRMHVWRPASATRTSLPPPRPAGATQVSEVGESHAGEAQGYEQSVVASGHVVSGAEERHGEGDVVVGVRGDARRVARVAAAKVVA